MIDDTTLTKTFYPVHPKILVLGHSNHGKTEVSKILSRLYGHAVISSSEMAFPYIWKIIAEAGGYGTKELTHERKWADRKLWKMAIQLINTPDKDTLTSMVLEKHSVYDGMRDIEEFKASSYMFDSILWVDASKRKLLDETMSIEYDASTMIYLDNNGPEHKLEGIVELLYEEYIKT